MRKEIELDCESFQKEILLIDEFISKDLKGMGAFETTQFLRGIVFVNLDFLMTTHTYQD